MRSASGKLIAHGEYLQIAHGEHVNARLVFHFLDGSIDDDNVNFTQDRTFRFVSEHHIQKGPFFPKPVDLTIEPNGQVTARTTEKDGKEKVETQHMDLPPDLSNGMVTILMLNFSPNNPQEELSMLVPADKLRMVKLKINPDGNSSFHVNGVAHTAALFRIKIEIGGIAGVIAPIVGKKPEDVMIWMLEGEAPAFIREVGQLYSDGPKVSIELAGTTFPRVTAAKH
ncbi:MAG TPA: hypothetical protein VGN16_11105 [Acidobacteriaceae bacterium]